MPWLLTFFVLSPCLHNHLTRFQCSCVVEFDGASKGNHGLAGALAVLRTADQRTIHCVREGVGIATNNTELQKSRKVQNDTFIKSCYA